MTVNNNRDAVLALPLAQVAAAAPAGSGDLPLRLTRVDEGRRGETVRRGRSCGSSATRRRRLEATADAGAVRGQAPGRGPAQEPGLAREAAPRPRPLTLPRSPLAAHVAGAGAPAHPPDPRHNVGRHGRRYRPSPRPARPGPASKPTRSRGPGAGTRSLSRRAGPQAAGPQAAGPRPATSPASCPRTTASPTAGSCPADPSTASAVASPPATGASGPRPSPRPMRRNIPSRVRGLNVNSLRLRRNSLRDLARAQSLPSLAPARSTPGLRGPRHEIRSLTPAATRPRPNAAPPAAPPPAAERAKADQGKNGQGKPEPRKPESRKGEQQKAEPRKAEKQESGKP